MIMSMKQYKKGALLCWDALESMEWGDQEEILTKTAPAVVWCSEVYQYAQPIPGFQGFWKTVQTVFREANGQISIRELKSLRPSLQTLCASLFRKLKLRLVFPEDFIETRRPPIKKGVPVTYGSVENGSGQELNVLLTDRTGTENPPGIDLTLTLEKLQQVVSRCFPMDSFAYDRLYLAGKMESLKGERSNTELVIAGSSYAMVGLLERSMPVPAVNLAVNAQDLYYTLLSVRRAVEACPKIRTAVIVLGYYAFFTDLAQSPSDYSLSILNKVMMPVWNDRHHWKGKPSRVSPSNEFPLYRMLFDLEKMQNTLEEELKRSLAFGEYYNEKNPRPRTGMLSYPFQLMSEEQNFRAAKVRAQAHDKSENRDVAEENVKVLSDFLNQMKNLGVKINFVIPPATEFYRASSSTLMFQQFQELFAPALKNSDLCSFFDFFESSQFDNTDFQDYDHLSRKGAEKFSGLLSNLCFPSGIKSDIVE